MTRSFEGEVVPTPDQVLDVETPTGPARAFVHHAVGSVSGLVMLGHGAGRGTDTPDLLALAADLPRHGLIVVRIDQPWVVAGGRVAPAPKTLDRGWREAVPGVQRALALDVPLIVGGRSAGARVACRTAEEVLAVAVLALAFPGHPPGRPDRPRWSELVGTGRSVMVVQGERDQFGSVAQVRDAVAGVSPVIEVTAVPWADHSFRVPARAPVTSEEALATMAQAVSAWCVKQIPR